MSVRRVYLYLISLRTWLTRDLAEVPHEEMYSKLEAKSFDSPILVCVSDQFEFSPLIFSFSPLQRRAEWHGGRCALVVGSRTPGATDRQRPKVPSSCLNAEASRKGPRLQKEPMWWKYLPAILWALLYYVHRIYIFPCISVRHVRIWHTHIIIFLNWREASVFGSNFL